MTKFGAHLFPICTSLCVVIKVYIIMVLDKKTGLPIKRDEGGTIRFCNPEARRRRREMRYKIVKVFLDWTERDGWSRIDIHPVDVSEWQFMKPDWLVVRDFARGDCMHLTVRLRDQVMGAIDHAHLNRVRTFFGAPRVPQQPLEAPATIGGFRWETTLRISWISGCIETGGFVATLCSGGPLAEIADSLRYLRRTHHGDRHLTVSM